MASEEKNIVGSKSRRSARWGEKVMAGILLAGVLLVIVVTARWVSAWWSMGRARSYQADATRLLDSGEINQGMALLVQAWQLAPQDPDIMRELARRSDKIPERAADAANFWHKIVNGPSATVDDSVSLAAALVKTTKAAAARHVLETLPVEVRQQPRTLEIEADLLMIEGREQESEKLLRIALERSPNDPDARFRLAKMKQTSAFDEIREEARHTLWELSRGGGKLASKALLALSTQPFSGSEILDVRAILSSSSGINNTDRLAILSACARQQPALADELVLEEAQRVAGKNPEDCAEYYTWLAKMGRAEIILNDLSENKAAKTAGSATAPAPAPLAFEPKAVVFESRDLFLAYGEALIMKRDWSTFSSLLTRPSLPIENKDAALMKALCAQGLGESVEVIDGHLAVALTFARTAKDAFELIRVADQAGQLNRPQMELQALMSFSSPNLIMRLGVLQRTYRLQKAMGLTDDLLTTADSILEAQPGMVPYVDEATYLRLLTGRDIEPVLNRFSPEQKDVPIEGTLSSQRLIWALSAYQCGSLDAARRWLDGMDASGLAVGQRAVFAGLLKATGRAADAFRIAEKIFPSAVLPEEKWFLQQALN